MAVINPVPVSSSARLFASMFTLTFLALGAARVFSVLFFLFLALLRLTLLTVRVMLVGVCCVAVYDTVAAETSSSPLSVALLSPTIKKMNNQKI